MRMKHEPPMFFGNPTCPHCGTTYKMLSDHFCPQGQQAKLDEYRADLRKVCAENDQLRETLHDRIFCAALAALISEFSFVPIPNSPEKEPQYKVIVSHAYKFADEALRQINNTN
jgi:glutaredoxin